MGLPGIEKNALRSERKKGEPARRSLGEDERMKGIELAATAASANL
jgi:hypothetical protein